MRCSIAFLRCINSLTDTDHFMKFQKLCRIQILSKHHTTILVWQFRHIVRQLCQIIPNDRNSIIEQQKSTLAESTKKKLLPRCRGMRKWIINKRHIKLRFPCTSIAQEHKNGLLILCRLYYFWSFITFTAQRNLHNSNKLNFSINRFELLVTSICLSLRSFASLVHHLSEICQWLVYRFGKVA